MGSRVFNTYLIRMLLGFFNRVLLLILFVITFIAVKASNVKFNNINSIYGISIRETNSVCKDYKGFIWVSSKTGILRLTEDDYRIYRLPYETANVISVKMVYQDSILLVYTNNGQFFLYNEVFDRFDRLINLNKNLNDVYLSVNSVIVGSEKNIWIASSSGLYEFKNNQIVRVDDNSSVVNGIGWYNDHEIILFRSGNLYLLDVFSKQMRTLYEPTDATTFFISSFLMDKENGVIWIGTVSSGLYYYDYNKGFLCNFPINSLPKQPILALELNTDSTIFAGIDGQGIWELDLKNRKVLNVYKENVNDPNSLRGNGVYDIFKDESNRVWVCTYSGGISYFDQASPVVDQITHQINNSNSLVNNDVNCIIEDHKGRLWIATNNGISCWDRISNKWLNYYSNKQNHAQVFLTLCEDNIGRIWAGTYSSGVYVLDAETGNELKHYSSREPNSPIKNDFVLDIYNDKNGDIWIGGVNSEIIRYNLKNDKFQELFIQPLYVFADYMNNEILLGCTYGLSSINKTTSNFNVLIDDFLVEDLWVDDSIIWICTSGDGLIRFNPTTGEKQHYNTITGLPSNFINSIVAIDNYLWLGTESGICRFNQVDNSVLTYSSTSSLSSLSYNRNAVCSLSDGQLAWGSNNGLIIFNPKAIQEVEHFGKIFIQDLSISGLSIREIPSLKINKPVDELDRITLKYNQNTVTLELLPIGVAPGSKFSWMLEGLDQNWNVPTNNRIVTYSNLKSKDFVLKIRLYDGSLSHIIEERELLINVTPPFWSTWYFFATIIMFTTIIIYFLLLYYVNLFKQKHTEEKIRFFTNTAHDMRTSLTLIKAPVEELKREMGLSNNGQYYLKLAKEQINRLTSVVTQLMDFQKVDIGRGQLVLQNVDIVNLIENRIIMFTSLADRREIKIKFYCEQPVFETAIDEVKLEKIIDNLISNAIKYSNIGGTVYLKLNISNEKFSITVSDEGIGISKKAQRQLFKEFYRADNAINTKIVGSGIGLLLVKNYVTLMGGNVNCESRENIGSTFNIEIPVKKKISGNNISANLVDSPYFHQTNDNQLSKIVSDSDSSDMSILIVEDHDDLRNFLKHALSNEFQVFIAEDGAMAWEIIKKDLPDLVISDVMMPNMNGFELCRLLKGTYETSHIPVILLTALTRQAEQLQGLGLGADDYMIKPFDVLLLKQKIKSIIKNREIVKGKALKLIKQNSEQPILSNEHNDQFVKKMLEVVQNNISNTNFNKNNFASEMNVSGSLLYKKVKSLTDQSPIDFIKVVRLNNALKLLQSQNYTVTEVSELCGFASVSYFSTVFKKHYGKSPTEINE